MMGIGLRKEKQEKKTYKKFKVYLRSEKFSVRNATKKIRKKSRKGEI
jgi:hypothetical protein